MLHQTGPAELDEILGRLRTVGSDLAQVEVKAASGGVPHAVWSTVSAFANTVGGTIVLGLDEAEGFRPVEGFDATTLRDGMVSGLARKVVPPVHGCVDIHTLDGGAVVVVDIDELPAHEKPCYVESQGKERGSYRRHGDGDHRMSTYEVFLHSVNVRQPEDDVAPVADATIDDLDHELVDGFLGRLRAAGRRAVEGVDDVDALRRLNVLSRSRPDPVPTVAGLLALGQYPQAFFPQWMVSVSAFPGGSKEAVVDDLRLLDHATVDGPIPVMVDRAVAVVLRSLRSALHSAGVGAIPTPEVPVDVLREALTNALTHRDYSAFVRGEQVLVDIFPDRVEVTNPGGIWGGRTTRDLLDGVSRSRNEKLALLLQDVPLPGTSGTVCENRGSGIPRMFGSMRGHGLAVPTFKDRTTTFTVVLDRHGLLDPDTRAALASIGADDLSTHAQCALALAARGNHVDDQVLRHQLAIDSRDAQRLLAGLVREGWLTNPARPGRSYGEGRRMRPHQPSLIVGQGQPRRSSVDDAILQAIGRDDEVGIHELAGRTGVSIDYLRQRLRVLVNGGQLVATAPPTSRHRRYRRPS